MVQSSQDDWQKLGDIWLSNGEEDCRGTIELQVRWPDWTGATLAQAAEAK